MAPSAALPPTPTRARFGAMALAGARYGAALLALAAAYYVGARTGLRWAVVQENVTAIWPPSGLAIAVLLRFGLRLWPGAALGAFLANLATGATPPLAALGIAAGNTAEVVLAAFLLDLSGFDRRMSRLGDVVRLVVLGMALPCAVAATNGAAQICFAGLAPWSAYGPIWTAWWLGDGLSVMVIAPVILAWTTEPLERPDARALVAVFFIAAALVGTGALAFGGWHGAPDRHAFAFAAFPAVLVATMRFRLRGATTATLLATVLMVAGLALSVSSTDGIAVVQVFAASLAVSGLALAAALSQSETTLKALQKSEDKLRVYAEAGSDWFWEQDAQFRFSYMSPINYWFTGLSADECIGKTRRELQPLDVTEDQLAGHEAVLRAHLPFKDFRYAVRDHDGRNHYIAVSGQPIFAPDGTFIGYRGVGRDVTAEEEARRAASDSHARFMQALENRSDALAFWDADDRLVICNSTYREQAGAAGHLLLPGVKFEHYIRESVRVGELRDAIGREEEWLAARLSHHRNPGSDFEFRRGNRWILAREQRTPDGGTLITALDVTELKNREEDLRRARDLAEQSHRVKSQFLANMSHELRTPLNAILGFAEVIRDQRQGPAVSRYAEYAEHIHDSGRHLLDLINDILDMSKIEAGRLRLKDEEFDAGVVVSSCVTMVGAAARAGNVEVQNTIPAALPAVLGDSRLLKQVVINVLSNAVKFTPAGGRVTISAEVERNGTLALVIADTGIGIAPADREKIFEPFRQGEMGFERRYEGTGLGLAISKSIMEMHGGAVIVDSAVGHGTTVTLRLPAARVIARRAAS